MFFRNELYFLSNMYPCKVGIYKSAETAFQACKIADKAERIKIFKDLDGYQAKKLGRHVNIRSDWNDIRVAVMYAVLQQKFKDPKLMTQLRAIEGYIQEDNTWNDTFWGVCNGKGQNVLGQLLMKIRNE